MTEGHELQDGIFVRIDGAGIVIENTWKLGSSNRILRLDSSACQKLLDFLASGITDDTSSLARDAEQRRGADADEQYGAEKTYSTRVLLEFLNNALDNGYETLGSTDVDDLLIKCEEEQGD